MNTLLDLQAQLLRSKNILDPRVLEQAYQFCLSASQPDLFASLLERNLITAELAAPLREEVLKAMRARFSAELGQHLVLDRWFKPHADHIWQKGEKLGEGGMGAVYRVKDQCLDRYGALKIVLGHDQKALARFMREVKMTARLDHPAIPPVYDAGITGNGQYYMVMKVIEGQTLKDRIAEIYKDASPNRSEIRDLLQVLVRVGEALSYAHSQGILHRDLKPENIMIGRFGEVLVLDWGIAKDLNGDELQETEEDIRWELTEEQLQQTGLTLTGSFVGTPGYMAPEQIDGAFSEQSDVFSLGLILTEILTGKKAIFGDSVVERIGSTASGLYQFPRLMNKRAPRELDSLARMALAVDLEQRLSSVEEFTLELKAHLSGEKLETYSYSLFENFFRWSSRHPGKIIGAALSVVLLSVIFVFQEAIQQSERARGLALNQLSAAEQREARTKEIFARLSQLEQAAQRGLPKDQVLKQLDEILEKAQPEYSLLLTAAKICHLLEEFDRESALLKQCSDKFPPAYEALFMQHKLTSPEAFLITPSLREIAKRAKERGEENEFSLVLEALSFYEKKDYEQALSRLILLEKYSTKFSFGYCLRGVIRGEQGKYQEGLVDIEYAKKIDPKNSMILYNHGFLLFCMKRWDEALESFNEAHKINPNNSLLLQRRGYLKHALNDISGALSDYELSLKLNPMSLATYLGRARLYGSQKRYELAATDYQRALKVSPDNVSALVGLSFTKIESGQTEQALALIEKALKLDPKASDAYNYRARISLRQERWQDAINDLDRYMALNTKNANAYFNRGSAKHRLGQLDGAIDDYKAATRLNPQMVLAHHQCGLALDASGRLEEAERYITLCLKRIEGYAPGYKLRCAVRIKLKNFRGAAEDCEEYLKRNPKDHQVVELRAFVRKHLGRPSRY